VRPTLSALAETLSGPPPDRPLPSNPQVRAYVKALTSDIASRGVASVVAESLHFHGLEHGFPSRALFHRARRVRPLPARALFLRPLPGGGGKARGASQNTARGSAPRARTPVSARAPAPDEAQLAQADVAAFAGGELGGYLQTRADTRRLRSPARPPTRPANEGATFLLHRSLGSRQGYATGRPTGDAAPTIAWQFGIDVGAVALPAGRSRPSATRPTRAAWPRPRRLRIQHGQVETGCR